MDQETLLIVEDNFILREGLRDILDQEGYRIFTAGNGREALEQMQDFTPDLILSDIAMPEMDGHSFFKAARSRPEWISIPFIFLTARGEKEDILAGKTLGAEDYLVKPLSSEELVTAVRARLQRSRQLRRVQLQQAYEASLVMLANAIDLRDPYTRYHVERVTEYAQVLANQLGWQERMLEQLRFGSILHDIGKIHIREATLLKVEALTTEEWQEIRQHPSIGANMIKDIPYLAPAVPVVRHHHERWDGSGYPDRLAGEAIPEGARIISVADAFDAMTTDRPYRPAKSLEEAIQEILACSGRQFDPAVVAAFQEAWEGGAIQAIWQRWYAQKAKLIPA